jgi:prepilin-type N-terminal cleavage/methylation domain-containing protein
MREYMSGASRVPQLLPPCSLVPPMLIVRKAFTLLELLIVLSVIGLVTSIAIPLLRPTLDALAVERATRDVMGAYSLSRFAALTHGGAELRLDSLGLTLTARGRVLHASAIVASHGVRMRASPAIVRYAGTGLATGLSNGSVILTRGRAADTVFVSRLGRARR